MPTIHASALLFDMDGTIIDSTAIVEKAWSVWAHRHNLNLAEVLHFSHGRPTLATMQHFAQFIDSTTHPRNWQDEADEMQRMELEMAGSIAIPGAYRLLSGLDPDRWAVVTSAPRQLAESRIIEADLPMPKILVPADEITQGKPHPEGYLKAARHLGFAAAECVVFEDTPPGVEAALAAGMQVVGLLTTVAAERLNTSILIGDYLEVQVVQTNGRLSLTFPAPTVR